MKIESKEKLAKLLATEDLDVQHQQVETAYFDVKSRTLVLPTWKEMPNNLYDLLVGHEVGHALFTPTSEDRLVKAYKKTSKACINILEDARIEKLVKKRYPGLRKSFFSGYQHLIEKDFFGLSKRNLESMNILDKINLYFKIPNAVDIQFNEIEQSFIDKIEKFKSFKDVENIAEEIYAYAKENQEEKEDQGDEPDYSQPMPSDEMVDGMEQDSFEQESNQGESDEGEDEEVGENEKPALTEEEEGFQKYMNGPDETDSSDESDEEESKSNDKDEVDGENSEVLNDSQPEGKPPEKEVKSETYDYFHERMQGLIDKNVKSVYLTVPDKVDLNTAVVDYKKVHKNIDDFYNAGAGKGAWQHYDVNRYENMREEVYKKGNLTLSKFKRESVKTVNHIASEFERKKAADVYKKLLITKTGVLDTNKLFSAKYNDDVFKKSVRLPEGKNHGLVMILDWSGSMQNNIFGCIKQVMELTFFCKKVNIPFEVYSFVEQQNDYDDRGQRIDDLKQSAFTYKNGDLVADIRVRLRNYLSSRMNARDYNNGLLNMCILANRYKRSSYGHYGHYPAPSQDELGCTPLNGAILLTEHVIRRFKRENNLDNVNAVFLTDGEANGSMSRYDVTKDHKYQTVRFWDDGSIKVNVYLKDTKTKKNHIISKNGHYTRGGMLTPVLLDMIKDRLGINIVGFFILDRFTANDLWRFVPRNNNMTHYQGQEHYKKFVAKARKDGWFVKTQSGYDEYYVIRGDSLKEEDLNNDLNVKPGMTAHRMATNFMKKNNAFKVNRVILSRFIDLITENTTV